MRKGRKAVMTLLDLWDLIKRSWVLVVALPVACALVCFGVMSALPQTYSATATLVASSDLSIVNAQAASAATRVSAETGQKVSTALNSNNQSVIVTAKGSSADACVAAANETAQAAREATLDFFAEDEPAEGSVDEATLYALSLLVDDQLAISVTEATAASNDSPSKAKYTIVAFIAGFLLAICIVVIRDMVRGSVHNAYEVEEKYGLNLLGRTASARRRSGGVACDASDEALLAALDFAGDGARALCLVPMERTESAKGVVGALEAASTKAARTLTALHDAAGLPLTDADALARQLAARMEAGTDLSLVVAPAVADSADYAYLAPACGRVVLVIEAMAAKRTNIEDALRQLALSHTPVAGFVMVNDR